MGGQELGGGIEWEPQVVIGQLDEVRTFRLQEYFLGRWVQFRWEIVVANTFLGGRK